MDGAILKSLITTTTPTSATSKSLGKVVLDTVLGKSTTNALGDAIASATTKGATSYLPTKTFSQNTLDLIDQLKSVGANVDDAGNVQLFHRTTPENAKSILSTGKMYGKEADGGLFFSTNKDYQPAYGESVIEARIPASKLTLDDVFDTNADVKYVTGKANQMTDMSPYLVQPTVNADSSITAVPSISKYAGIPQDLSENLQKSADLKSAGQDWQDTEDYVVNYLADAGISTDFIVGLSDYLKMGKDYKAKKAAFEELVENHPEDAAKINELSRAMHQEYKMVSRAVPKNQTGSPLSWFPGDYTRDSIEGLETLLADGAYAGAEARLIGDNDILIAPEFVGPLDNGNIKDHIVLIPSDQTGTSIKYKKDLSVKGHGGYYNHPGRSGGGSVARTSTTENLLSPTEKAAQNSGFMKDFDKTSTKPKTVEINGQELSADDILVTDAFYKSSYPLDEYLSEKENNPSTILDMKDITDMTDFKNYLLDYLKETADDRTSKGASENMIKGWDLAMDAIPKYRKMLQSKENIPQRYFDMFQGRNLQTHTGKKSNS